ncbi:NAD(P)H-hydrate dehydratase [Bordetella holmesii]|uniref:ADP-dependent (S)-NAD(P)H-hydrate dehydratase n=2 Tax=Bordetella holmesii TaxID=35814 RepID=A0A158M6R5_9BORD|nr:NAD(P)H-hydrate dehydratase [Bordetella holmesii]AHV91153.1 phosphomethylpyrimidine kinase family protein [Bordetella holmesii ATCC 51541]EWM44282.1 phosphomethylpyrimidine kinase family protein [Bordetella holmesii 41130]AMD45447.1 ADP-dependent (S)-NAD(P)H-hydrate dehydratase [Bordetella holmesii H558]AMD49127.1 ADP-dependent (S)-NAD(P)H-hydrate dehydratase [Bordetella holmesii F627]AOB34336.1 NAD(P)H-hydrate dehydratase [Bordetella holmesii]
MPASLPERIERSQFPALFAPRAPDSHKGSFGSLAVVGGGPGMTGAALLVARAALKLGAGKVLVGLAQQTIPLSCDFLQPELMVRQAADLLASERHLTAWTAGCGIGTTALAAHTLAELFQRRRSAPMVLDADGLNLLATGQLRPNWGQGPVVLTPHPAEAARLLGRTTAQVQAARPAAARELAHRYGAWIVLKGAGSLVCAPDGACLQNATGNPGLASAGTGDVLAGMLGSLLAQALPPEQAVAGAVWLHGAAADALVAQGQGPIGLTAGELADAARAIRNGRWLGP